MFRHQTSIYLSISIQILPSVNHKTPNRLTLPLLTSTEHTEHTWLGEKLQRQFERSERKKQKISGPWVWVAKSHNKSLAGTNHHHSVKACFSPSWRTGPALLQLPVILRTTHSRAFLTEEIIFILFLSSTPELLPGIIGEYQKPECQRVGLCWKRKDPKANHGASPCAFTNSPWACSSTKQSAEKLIPTFQFKFRHTASGIRYSFTPDWDLCTFLYVALHWSLWGRGKRPIAIPDGICS